MPIVSIASCISIGDHRTSPWEEQMRHRIQRASRGLVLALLFPLFTQPLFAQESARLTGSDCGLEPGVVCPLRLITEVTAGMAVRHSVGDKLVDRVHLAASLGMVAPVVPRLGLGAVATLGYRNDNPYLLVGPRLRFYAMPTIALDITPGFQVKRPEAEAGPLLIDVSLMHRDRVGINVQAASSVRYDYSVIPSQSVRLTSLYAGLRLGGRTGRTGVLAGAAALLVGDIIVLACNCVY